jgi:polyisoprenoid-binding protein YceI
MRKNRLVVLFAIVTLQVASLAAQAEAPAQELVLQLDPALCAAEIQLSGNFHSVEGSFAFQRGTIRYSPATGAVHGEIVFDATSGKTGNSSRDRKMHKDVIESQRYPEIAFRPDRADGSLAISGESTLKVHGQFAIHGDEHEVTIPVQVTMHGNAWAATASFTVPYAKWGMKNPSKLFLRVDNEVKVQFRAAGSLTP